MKTDSPPPTVLPARRAPYDTDAASRSVMNVAVGFAIVVMFGLAAPAWAGFDEGWEAYQRGDYAAALEEWRPLARQGDAAAQCGLGNMYRAGSGVPRDHGEAVRWYLSAAMLGYAEAQYNLGSAYFDGAGIAQDYTKAARWFREAAEQGFGEAQARFGVMYFNGAGVPQDYVIAHMWVNLAAGALAPGTTRDSAISLRDYLAGQMTSIQITTSRRIAREWLARHGE